MRSSSRAISSLALRPVTSKTLSAAHLMILRPRIVVLVDAVPEPHQLKFAVLDFLDVGRDIIFGSNLIEHTQHFFVGSAM